MRAHFLNLLASVWTNVVQAFGTTTLSIIVWSFAVPIVIWIITVAVDTVQRGRRREVSPLKNALVGSLLSAAITGGVTLIVRVGILSVFCVKSIYQDHTNLVSTGKALRVDNKKLSDERDEWKAKASVATNVTRKPPASAGSSERQRKQQIRQKLGDFMIQGIVLRDRCATDSPSSRLEMDADDWYGQVLAYLNKELDSSYDSQFRVNTPSAMQPPGVPRARLGLWILLDEKVQSLNKFIDQLK